MFDEDYVTRNNLIFRNYELQRFCELVNMMRTFVQRFVHESVMKPALVRGD